MGESITQMSDIWNFFDELPRIVALGRRVDRSLVPRPDWYRDAKSSIDKPRGGG